MFFLQQVINGLALGSVYALLAIGFSMIYGILRMMNFAHGDTYAFSTIFIAALLMDGAPVIPALALGILVGALVAILVERACYRPLRGVDRSVSMIAAIGAAFVLRNASEYFWGVRHSPFPSLLGTDTIDVGEVQLPVTGLLVLLVALSSVALINVFLRHFRLGQGILLVAQDIPTASLMGVPINRTVILVYAIGGALGVIGGILYGSVYGVAFPAMGFAGTIKAFVAAVIGGVGSLSGALIAGLFLGVVETLVVVYGGDLIGMPSGYRDAVAFVILIIFLLFRPTGLMGTRVSMSETGTAAGMGVSAKKAKDLSIFGTVALPRWAPWAGVLALLIAFPMVIDNPYLLRIANLIMMYGIAVLGVNLVLGYCGQFHFGQAGFLAIGAYTTALMMVHWDVNFLVALVASGSLAFLFGLLIGVPSLRIRSDYLALVTLAFGEIVRIVLLNSEFSRGPMGIPGIPLPSIGGFELRTNVGFYYYALILLVLSFILCRRICRSFIGRAWKAIAEDETAAAAMGIDTGRYKILAFGLACFLGGIAGSYMATFTRYIAPNSFTIDQSVLILVMLVIGGLGNLPGSLLGAAIMLGAIELLRPISEFRIAFIGLVMILIPVFRPQGLFTDGFAGLSRVWALSKGLLLAGLRRDRN